MHLIKRVKFNESEISLIAKLSDTMNNMSNLLQNADQFDLIHLVAALEGLAVTNQLIIELNAELATNISHPRQNNLADSLRAKAAFLRCDS